MTDDDSPPAAGNEGGQKRSKPSVRKRADAIKPYRCKNLIAVMEDPEDIKNIGTVIRNVNALGVEKVYVVDPNHSLSDDGDLLAQHPYRPLNGPLLSGSIRRGTVSTIWVRTTSSRS